MSEGILLWILGLATGLCAGIFLVAWAERDPEPDCDCDPCESITNRGHGP